MSYEDYLPEEQGHLPPPPPLPPPHDSRSKWIVGTAVTIAAIAGFGVIGALVAEDPQPDAPPAPTAAPTTEAGPTPGECAAYGLGFLEVYHDDVDEALAATEQMDYDGIGAAFSDSQAYPRDMGHTCAAEHPRQFSSLPLTFEAVDACAIVSWASSTEEDEACADALDRAADEMERNAEVTA